MGVDDSLTPSTTTTDEDKHLMLCNGILRSIKFNCDLLEPRTTFIFMSSESRWSKMILVNACEIYDIYFSRSAQSSTPM